jgi:hypothetical protein
VTTPLLIIFQTYRRTQYAVPAIQAIKTKLRYDGQIKWLVIDDGSEDRHIEQIIEQIGISHLYTVYSHRVGYGRLANWAWAESAKHTPLTLWLEDDWVLQRPFDLLPYARLLMERDHLGMVRFGQIPSGLEGLTEGYDGQTYLRLYKSKPYYFSGNPSLRHSRFYDAYGPYPEGLNPGDTEIAYDRQIQQRSGPHILIPVDVGTWGVFGHIGTEQSYQA